MKRFSLFLLVGFFLAVGFSSASGGQVVFEWDPNGESDLAGYRLYQTATTGQYTFGATNAVGDTLIGTETFTLVTQEDGTFYCETSAVVGDSKCKYYTLEYKRRARRIKYDTVGKLATAIDSAIAIMPKSPPPPILLIHVPSDESSQHACQSQYPANDFKSSSSIS